MVRVEVQTKFKTFKVQTRKRKGRPTLAESALKLDKLQQIEKNKSVEAKRNPGLKQKEILCYQYIVWYQYS